jgi:SagB-type dehydrogenase family enzyme
MTLFCHQLTALLSLVSLALGAGSRIQAAEPGPIPLPPPQTEGGKPFMQTLKERQTVREFSAQPLSAQQLSDLLWAGFGMNRPQISHRTAPSAMNSQEIDVFVALTNGVFRYEARGHRLEVVAEEDVRAKTGGQDFAKVAPVTLVFVADLSRLGKAAPADRERYAWVDTGYISQNIYLYCASAGLGTVVHDLNRAPVREALKLSTNQVVVLAQAVGFPKGSVLR